MSNDQIQVMYDEKTIQELQQKVERLDNALRIERLRSHSLRLQLEGRTQRPAMAANL